MIDLLVAELGRIVRVRVLRIKVRRRSGDEPWFDEFRRTADSLSLLEELKISC